MSRGFPKTSRRFGARENSVKEARREAMLQRRSPSVIWDVANKQAKKLLDRGEKNQTQYETTMRDAAAKEIAKDVQELLTKSPMDKYVLTPDEQRTYDENGVFNQDYVSGGVREEIAASVQNIEPPTKMLMSKEQVDNIVASFNKQVGAIAAQEVDLMLKSRREGTMDMRDAADQITSLRTTLFNVARATAERFGVSATRALGFAYDILSQQRTATLDRAARIKQNKGRDVVPVND